MTYGNNQRIDADKQFANVPRSLLEGGAAIGHAADVRRAVELTAGIGAVANGTSALDVQVGGGHYKSKAIQPVEYSAANNLNFLEGCIVKRITRWREKNGFEDLLKIKHEVDLLIEMEQKYNMKAEAAMQKPTLQDFIRKDVPPPYGDGQKNHQR